MGAVLRDLIFDIGLPREHRAGRRIDILSPNEKIALLSDSDRPYALCVGGAADHSRQRNRDADLRANGSCQAHAVLPISPSHTPQYAACPGVRGNGIASRTLASPVT